MPRKLDHDVFYRPPGTPLYNIFFKGGALQGRVTVRAFESLRPEQIDWVWMIDEKRRATQDEIRKLCKAPTKGRERSAEPQDGKLSYCSTPTNVTLLTSLFIPLWASSPNISTEFLLRIRNREGEHAHTESRGSGLCRRSQRGLRRRLGRR